MDERIRVAVRLRPLSEDERAAQEPVVIVPEADRALAIHEAGGSVCSSSYDAVFAPGASNGDVFSGVLRGMLAEALAGKNATVFAYGQTGSGKTHTIEGLMLLAAQFIFSSIAETPGREFLLKLSAVEVYNEAVHDLLRRDSGRMELTETRSGRTIVKGVREEHLASGLQLQRLLRAVRDNRKVQPATAAHLNARTCTSARHTGAHAVPCAVRALPAWPDALNQASSVQAHSPYRLARPCTTSTARARTSSSPSWSRAAARTRGPRPSRPPPLAKTTGQTAPTSQPSTPQSPL